MSSLAKPTAGLSEYKGLFRGEYFGKEPDTRSLQYLEFLYLNSHQIKANQADVFAFSCLFAEPLAGR